MHADMTAARPSDVAIGRDSCGRFKTAKHKEYPSQFCKGLVHTIVQFLTRSERRCEVRTTQPLKADLQQWLQGAAKASSSLYQDSWLPDFQTLP